MGPHKTVWVCTSCRISMRGARALACPGCGRFMVAGTTTRNEDDMATTKKPAEPLTAAQIELVQQLIADRQERITTEVSAMIVGQVDALAQRLQPQIDESIKYGEKLALRAAAGKLLCAEEGGPTADQLPFTFTSRENVGPHESFTTERGRS